MRYLLCALFFLAGTAQAEVMEVRAEPGVDEKLVVAVKKAMESYNGLLKEKMGLELKKSVRIDICPSEECYSNKLYDFGYRGEQREKTAKLTTGLSFPDMRRILLKLTHPSQLKWANSLVSSSLTFFLQGELADGGSFRANRWLGKGMGDFIGVAVAQKMGMQSFDKWKLEVVNALRRTENYPMPQELAEINDQNDWLKITEKYKGKNDLMADLMVVYLYEKKGQKLFGALTEYYRCLGNTFTREKTCFAKNFDLEPEQFYPQVQTWVAETLAKSGTFEIVAKDQDAEVTEISTAYRTTQALLEEKLGRKLDIAIRIHLAQTPKEMATQLANELGVSEAEAAKRVKSRSWLEDSLLFIDTSRSNTAKMRAELIGQVVMSSYLQMRAGNVSRVYWFNSGLQDWMAGQLLEKLGLQTLEQRAAIRKEVLINAKKGAPTLAELMTQADWNKAMSKYGAEVVRQYAADATDSLLTKKGVASLGVWAEINKRLNGSPEAFTQVFGEPADKIVQSFKSEVSVN